MNKFFIGTALLSIAGLVMVGYAEASLSSVAPNTAVLCELVGTIAVIMGSVGFMVGGIATAVCGGE